MDYFNHLGHLREDFDEAEIEAMGDAERAAFMTMLADCRAAETAEAHLSVTRLRVHDLMKAHDAALAAEQIANPASSFQENMLAVINAKNGHLTPKAEKDGEKVARRERRLRVEALAQLAKAPSDSGRRPRSVSPIPCEAQRS